MEPHQHNHTHGHSHDHNDTHGHTHGHGFGHSHTHTVTTLNAAFIVGITLNLLYLAIEVIFGILSDSMGLLSDAGHNLADIASLFIALIAFKLAKWRPNSRRTFGLRKLTVQASFINAMLLCVAVGTIIVESIEKIINPEEVDGDTVAWVAGIGIVVNGLTAWLLHHHQKSDINVKGAFLHMLTDALMAIGVMVAGLIIHFTGWYIIDPIIGLVIAIILAISTKQLLVESFRLSTDQVPSSIDIDHLLEEMKGVEGVEEISQLHVWALSTTENALTAHVIVGPQSTPYDILSRLRHIAEAHHIADSTIEIDPAFPQKN